MALVASLCDCMYVINFVRFFLGVIVAFSSVLNVHGLIGLRY